LIDCLSLGFNTQWVDGDFEFFDINEYVPLGSMAPPRSLSKRSKALLISKTYSTVQYSLAKSFGLKLIFFEWWIY
jgi:hypothetical protein